MDKIYPLSYRERITSPRRWQLEQWCARRRADGELEQLPVERQLEHRLRLRFTSVVRCRQPMGLRPVQGEIKGFVSAPLGEK